MSYDAFTWSAVMIIAVVIIFVIIVGRSRAATEIKLRNVSHNLTMMHSDEDAREVCRAIRKKYPHLCPGIDYTIRMNGDKAEIEQWNTSEPRPDL